MCSLSNQVPQKKKGCPKLPYHDIHGAKFLTLSAFYHFKLFVLLISLHIFTFLCTALYISVFMCFNQVIIILCFFFKFLKYYYLWTFTFFLEKNKLSKGCISSVVIPCCPKLTEFQSKLLKRGVTTQFHI